MRKLFLPIILVCAVTSFTFAQTVNITFELNVASLGNNVDPTGMFIGGGSGFGGPTDNPMTDAGNGIWTITFQQPAGFASHYTFLNGNSGWGAKENIAGLPCADPANFNDRYLPPVMQDTTVKACFGQCISDGSCVIQTDSIQITFMLNAASISSISPDGLFIAGGGNFGVPGDNQMLDPDGDGTYEITVTKAKGFGSFYTFTNGACAVDWSCKEDLTGLPCGDPANFNDRTLPPVYSDTTVMACFGQCSSDGSCATSTSGLLIDKNLFTLQPTIVNNFANVQFSDNAGEKQVTVVNAVGQVMISTTVGNTDLYQIDAINFTNGVYFITVNTAETKLTKKFMVVK